MNTRANLCDDQAHSQRRQWVRETRFGRWFLSTNTWRRYVLGEAIPGLHRLLREGRPTAPRILDAGCGAGLAFSLLEQTFQPEVLVGVDIDREMTTTAATAARGCRCRIELATAPILDLDYPGRSFDMIFCHQLLHHTYEQEEVLRKFFQLLVPGGVLLIGESCRPFIRSWPVRLLFRHPMMVQKTADEYVELVRAMGYEVGERAVERSTPWWSRPDLGVLKRLGIAGDKPLPAAEVLIVAKKPAGNP